MSRTEIQFADLDRMIAYGWHLAWFSLGEPAKDSPNGAPRELLADVYWPTQVGDGQINHYRVVLDPNNEPKDLARIQLLVGIAKAQWVRALDSALEHACTELQP